MTNRRTFFGALAALAGAPLVALGLAERPSKPQFIGWHRSFKGQVLPDPRHCAECLDYAQFLVNLPLRLWPKADVAGVADWPHFALVSAKQDMRAEIDIVRNLGDVSPRNSLLVQE